MIECVCLDTICSLLMIALTFVMPMPGMPELECCEKMIIHSIIYCCNLFLVSIHIILVVQIRLPE